MLDGDRVRDEVLSIVDARGKMQNPVTGSGGMLVGTVAEVGPESPLGLSVGDRVATLVSLSLTPLALTDGLSSWDGRSEQVPASGHAILFGRSIAAVLPDDLDPTLSLAVMDVCGAPALVDRVVRRYVSEGRAPTVAVVGGAGKSGSMSLAAARRAGASRTVGIVPVAAEAGCSRRPASPTSSPSPTRATRWRSRTPSPARWDVRPTSRSSASTCPGCEHGAVLATADGGTVVFFSMATSFTAAALGAEGLAADVTMLIGNGYVPGHADLALQVLRETPGVRALFERRLT